MAFEIMLSLKSEVMIVLINTNSKRCKIPPFLPQTGLSDSNVVGEIQEEMTSHSTDSAYQHISHLLTEVTST